MIVRDVLEDVLSYNQIKTFCGKRQLRQILMTHKTRISLVVQRLLPKFFIVTQVFATGNFVKKTLDNRIAGSSTLGAIYAFIVRSVLPFEQSA